MPITNQGPTQQVVPNVYVQVLPPLQALNPYIATSLNGFVGVGNWGPVNTPVFCGDSASITYAFGNDSVGLTTSGLNASLIQEMLTALNEDGNSVGVRVTDGTDTPATIKLIDTAGSPGTLVTLTARYSGSLPMGNVATNTPAAGARVDSVGTNLFRVTIFFPNQAPQVYNNISGGIGFGGGGGSYSASVFKNNVIAAINGTAPNTTPNPFFFASTGASTVAPKLATVFAPDTNSGTDGTLGVVTATLIGTDSATGARTGIYALRGTGAFHMAICGCTDLAQAATLSAFCTTENIALAFLTVPKGTSDSGAVGLRVTNSVALSNVVLVKDFIYVYDAILQTYRYVSPIGKAMGIVGLLAPYASPINQPYEITGLSAAGVYSTEQTPLGPRSQDELGYLLTNGFVSITNQIPLNNGAYGFFDDVCSNGDPATNNGAGTYIPVTRMTSFLSQAFEDIGAQYVGKPQSTAANDPTRLAIEGAFNNFLSSLKPNGGQSQIDSYNVTCDLTNNSPASIAAGYCYVKILVRYLGIVRILWITLQGGTNVTISNQPPSAG